MTDLLGEKPLLSPLLPNRISLVSTKLSDERPQGTTEHRALILEIIHRGRVFLGSIGDDVIDWWGRQSEIEKQSQGTSFWSVLETDDSILYTTRHSTTSERLGNIHFGLLFPISRFFDKIAKIELFVSSPQEVTRCVA